MDERAGGRVLGIGELLWDLFPDGPRLGGAPFNVVANLRRFGHPAAFVTAVGDDDLGRAALAAVDRLGVDGTFIGVALDMPTGTVAVSPDPIEGHRFTIGSPAAYESIGDSGSLVARLAAWTPDALVYGTLAQRSAGVRDVTHRVATEIRPSYRLYDVNLREGCWTPELVREVLTDATIVKVNESESVVLADLLGVDASPAALAAVLAARHGVTTLCITRGGNGATLVIDGSRYDVDGIPVDVVDTVGAGDAFAATLLHGILTETPPEETLTFANRVGALVATRSGALPPWSADELG
ncbi:MAG TPA: carbohydrate kinase [Candidatus Limnocylindrales bacterium]|nr:carbohydrate kinase [Candidatus Limnocylindrales bacterium]